jgi:hypothetical protein
MIAEYVITELAMEVMEMKDSGRDTTDQEAYVREQLTSVYDDHIWEAVEEHELEFEDVVYDLLDEVMMKAEYYDNNRQ